MRDTDMADWQRVVDRVRACGWPTSYEEDGVSAAMPALVEEVFDRGSRAALLWQIEPAPGIRVNCQFYVPYEIEFDLDPREVGDQTALDVVCHFLREVGAAVQKPVVVTEEMSPDARIMSYDPGTDEVIHGPFRRGN